ncbi:MAG: spermidine synthase [bacterium]|nr:spermidine synthase [bacterium]
MDALTGANKSRWQYALFALFALSGFSGLIYESIWSHYLKLFLGHAAYAQTLVLALFMGGMAAGAWLAGRCMPRLRNPLMAYALVELVIGLFGLLFHRNFQVVTGFMLDTLLPGMGSVFAIELVRWSMAALLILPQTLLLGATFPLMSVGLLRAFPRLPGSSIALLYFTNSLGAVVGVLVSGFWLIGLAGLPGTIMVAALVNFLLALAVYLVGRQLTVTTVPQTVIAGAPSALLRPLLLVALVTGLSSFIYEIGWIRMLVLVLGASTHAFELMLSAFILGLALGGLWVRQRIDSYADPQRALGYVQLLMGFLALGTVVFYNRMFDLMQFAMSALQRNDAGYFLFNLSSHFIAVLVMLPVTFMAGMTLPLITFTLFRHGGDESAIGRVYAFNTLGAIIGVCLTVLLLMPAFGLKTTIMIGALLDLLLGAYMLARTRTNMSAQRVVLVLGTAAVITVAAGVSFDPLRMISGVFRNGHGVAQGTNILFHRDGRTATVDVYESRGTRIISTNGKPDAGVVMPQGMRPSPDEPTMVLLGGIALLAHPEARTAAVIGMGSGISANVLLSGPDLRSVDIVEIESAIVDGARFFGAHSARVFQDPRSHIHIDDAKSYFAAYNKRYDLIISEPSNPWVSGVSSLFTQEFYARVLPHLNNDGVLVQWFHLYETNPKIISSILTALSPQFSDYAIYAASSSDMVLIAKKSGKLPALSPAMFAVPAFRDEFRRVEWFTLQDVEAHRIGDKALLDGAFHSFDAPANSDFFPYVDQHAVAARYKGEQAGFLIDISNSPLPLPGINFREPPHVTATAKPIGFQPREAAITAQKVVAAFTGTSVNWQEVPENIYGLVELVAGQHACGDEKAQQVWRTRLVDLMSIILPRVNAAAATPMLDYLTANACADPGGLNAEWLALFRAVAQRNMPEQQRLSESLLTRDATVSDDAARYVLVAAMVANLEQGENANVQALASLLAGARPVLVDLLLARAEWALARQVR